MVLRRNLGSSCAVLAVALLASGCLAGRPSSTSAWQSASERALGEAISGLGTAQVLVSAEVRDELPHTYTVVTADDAVDGTAREIASYLRNQPPDDLHRATRAVVAALHEAELLLVEVRVELASPGVDEPQSRDLIDRLEALHESLDRLSDDVATSPRSVGAG